LRKPHFRNERGWGGIGERSAIVPYQWGWKRRRWRSRDCGNADGLGMGGWHAPTPASGRRGACPTVGVV